MMSAIDQYRSFSGFILMAATNRLDGPDEALIREGRFDVKIRLDLPDEATRASILEAQLSKKPWRRFDVREIASQTPGASAARLRALVDQAASYALAENRKIEVQDLQRLWKQTAVGIAHSWSVWNGTIWSFRANPARYSVHHPFARGSRSHSLAGT
jgi:ATP-dependent Zn protease